MDREREDREGGDQVLIFVLFPFVCPVDTYWNSLGILGIGKEREHQRMDMDI